MLPHNFRYGATGRSVECKLLGPYKELIARLQFSHIVVIVMEARQIGDPNSYTPGVEINASWPYRIVPRHRMWRIANETLDFAHCGVDANSVTCWLSRAASIPRLPCVAGKLCKDSSIILEHAIRHPFTPWNFSEIFPQSLKEDVTLGFFKKT